jgi:uncharacterized protein YdaU (DUF1376 family)
MSEHKLHYFDFYFQRFIASTKGWSDEEVGAYVKLLIEQADRGFIPEDPMELSRLITSYKKNWPLVSKKFKAGENPGELQNGFMIDVRNAAIKKIEANANNGKKGGRPKKRSLSDGKATGFGLETDGLATENPTPNPTETQVKAIPVTSNQYPVKEKDKKENWDYYPKADLDLLLESTEITGAIEFIFRLKQIMLTDLRIADYWVAFRLNLSGDQFYQTRSELVKHFRNWLKDQKIEQTPVVKIEQTGSAPLKKLTR